MPNLHDGAPSHSIPRPHLWPPLHSPSPFPQAPSFPRKNVARRHARKRTGHNAPQEQEIRNTCYYLTTSPKRVGVTTLSVCNPLALAPASAPCPCPCLLRFPFPITSLYIHTNCIVVAVAVAVAVVSFFHKVPPTPLRIRFLQAKRPVSALEAEPTSAVFGAGRG